MATSCVMYQRFFYSKSYVRYNFEHVAMGCVCLGKIPSVCMSSIAVYPSSNSVYPSLNSLYLSSNSLYPQIIFVHSLILFIHPIILFIYPIILFIYTKFHSSDLVF